VATVRYLVEHKANLEAREKDGETPIYLAAAQNKSKTLNLLVELRADVRARNKDGKVQLP
jgi:ankyrin repeat protein